MTRKEAQPYAETARKQLSQAIETLRLAQLHGEGVAIAEERLDYRHDSLELAADLVEVAVEVSHAGCAFFRVGYVKKLFRQVLDATKESWMRHGGERLVLDWGRLARDRLPR